MNIHPTAIVNSGASIAEDVIIREYSIIGPDVTIGRGTIVGPHVVIDGWTTIGERNRIFPFTTIGYPPQDLKYKGGRTRVVMGNDNIIRENVTIHRGTEHGGGLTKIGNGNLIMAYAHIAHDCFLGDSVIMANAATLGGHVRIENNAVIGGLAAVHQFVRIGEKAYIGGKTGVSRDIPPFMLARGYPAKLYGPNVVGLRRQGVSSESISAIKRAYRIIFRSNLTIAKALERVCEEFPNMPEEVRILVEFIRTSKRGITR